MDDAWMNRQTWLIGCMDGFDKGTDRQIDR